MAPVEGKTVLSLWFKVVDANSRNLNLESKPQERPKRPETSRVFEKLSKAPTDGGQKKLISVVGSIHSQVALIEHL